MLLSVPGAELLSVCVYVCVVFTAHLNCAAAALGAGGGAGGVSCGSQAVHGLCLRSDWMSTVSPLLSLRIISTHSFTGFYVFSLFYDCLDYITMKDVEKKHLTEDAEQESATFTIKTAISASG